MGPSKKLEISRLMEGHKSIEGIKQGLKGVQTLFHIFFAYFI